LEIQDPADNPLPPQVLENKPEVPPLQGLTSPVASIEELRTIEREARLSEEALHESQGAIDERLSTLLARTCKIARTPRSSAALEEEKEALRKLEEAQAMMTPNQKNHWN